uniref:Uncharacterized protein n=1 Tax=Pararge aegeria TaxID=116150 RepID=S4P822_9NEOP
MQFLCLRPNTCAITLGLSVPENIAWLWKPIFRSLVSLLVSLIEIKYRIYKISHRHHILSMTVIFLNTVLTFESQALWNQIPIVVS